jgi:CMP-N,N'-diacetyllegionaminic acid synthase
MSDSRPKTLALIPARAGSKTIPHKNLRSVGGKPILGIAVEQAAAARGIDRVVVSTDDADYAALARQFGAETPFLRPAEFATDDADDLGVFRHAITWLRDNEDWLPEIVVHVRPTHPRRSAEDIAAVVDLLVRNPGWDSVRSVVPAPATPFKMWHRNRDGTIRPLVTCDVPDAHSKPRQALPEAYLQNACVDAVRSRTVLELGSMAGPVVGAYFMEHFGDIDDIHELAAAEASMLGLDARPRTFCIDIDGVVATLVAGNDYSTARPITDVIAAINRLKAAGHRVVFHTARGTMTGIAWEEKTAAQLRGWGVQFDALHVGKPAADFYVDDRAMTPGQFLAAVAALGGSGPASATVSFLSG